MFAAVGELSKKFTIVLLSNQFQSRTKHLRENENFGFFSSVIFSSEVRMKKPNEEIFDKVLNDLSQKSSACLFIDDAPENIQSAAALGFQTFLYEGQPPPVLLKTISQWGGEANS